MSEVFVPDITTPSTTIASTTASKGGVFNGGFELGSGTASSDAWIGAEAYGWVYLSTGTGSATYDTTVTHFGKQSMKLVGTVIGAGVYAVVASNLNVLGGAPAQNHYFRLKGSTKYRATIWIKTQGITAVASGGVYAALCEFDSTLTGGLVVNTLNSYITGTQDFACYTITFTTAAATVYGSIFGTIAFETGTAWFDDIAVEEVVEDAGYTGTISTSLLSSIAGVTSITAIDQTQTLSSTGAAIGNNNAYRAVGQSFVPTKSKLASVDIYKGSSTSAPAPSGTITVRIETDSGGAPSGTILAAKTYTQATWDAFPTGQNNIPTPCILTAGATYWIVVIDSAAESAGVYYVVYYQSSGNPYPTLKTYNGSVWSAAVANAALYFTTYYAEPTEETRIVCNGEVINLSSNADGLLSGAIVDLDEGKYIYTGGIAYTETDKMCDIYSSSAGASTDSSSYPLGVNGWNIYVLAGYGLTYQTISDATTRNIVWKINTLLPIRHIRMRLILYSAAANDKVFQVSTNNTSWTTVWTLNTATAAYYENVIDTDAVNGCTTFYLRAFKDAVADFLVAGIMYIEAYIDTPSISLPMVYPLSTNQFSEDVTLLSAATRAYFRLAKFANTRGVVVPHIEFTDGSANYIGTIPLILDNSLETNPAIDIIVADTTYGQQSGTGSNDGTTGYILNDGEYMTFSTTTAAPKITYKVGKGTTSFSNITKNVVYLSSNGVSNDATKDPSHQMSVAFWYRVQGLIRAVQDGLQKIQDIGNGLATRPIETKWSAWTPTLTWATATPVSVSTTARYARIGNTIFFVIYITSTDSNATTGLTITGLPGNPYSGTVYPVVSAYENYNTAGTKVVLAAVINPDSGSQNLQFLNFATPTDGQKVQVYVTGFYETL